MFFLEGSISIWLVLFRCLICSIVCIPFSGVHSTLHASFGGCKFDLVIAYVLKGLPNPNVSPLPIVCLELNLRISSHIEAYCDFVGEYVCQDICMHVCFPKVKEVLMHVMAYPKIYDFAFAKDWWGIHDLALCLGVDRP